MTKASGSLQELRRRIYRKAKSETTHRFWGLFVHITKIETLEEAYRIAKGNGGAPGIDGQSFRDIESAGRVAFLAAVREDLVTGRYKPMPNRKVEIPKGNGKFRTLQIPCIRDRVVQGALKLILEAVFEADFCPNSYGFRPKRSPHRALAEVRRSVMRRMSTVIDVDLSRYFDTIRHSVLLDKIAQRIQDPQVLHLVKQIIKVGGKVGVPQGGPFSPLAANIYLNEVDWFFDAIRRRTAEGAYEAVNYHRFADDSAPRAQRGRGGPNVCNCLIDEGRPLGTGWQEQVPNHLRRLWSKAMVVSTEGKGLGRTRSGDWQEEDRKGTTDDMSKA